MRNWLTASFLVGVLVAAVVTTFYTSFTYRVIHIHGVGRHSEGPAFTAALISDIPWILRGECAAIVVASIAVGLVFRCSKSREAKWHSISLIALAMYHALLMVWAAFFIGLYLVPRIADGI